MTHNSLTTPQGLTISTLPNGITQFELSSHHRTVIDNYIAGLEAEYADALNNGKGVKQLRIFSDEFKGSSPYLKGMMQKLAHRYPNVFGRVAVLSGERLFIYQELGTIRQLSAVQAGLKYEAYDPKDKEKAITWLTS